jgi:hypothetical protein
MESFFFELYLNKFYLSRPAEHRRATTLGNQGTWKEEEEEGLAG